MNENLFELLIRVANRKKYRTLVVNSLKNVGNYPRQLSENTEELRFLEDVEAALKRHDAYEKQLLGKIGELELQVSELLLDH